MSSPPDGGAGALAQRVVELERLVGNATTLFARAMAGQADDQWRNEVRGWVQAAHKPALARRGEG